MTRKEYIKQKANELREQAHSHSLERETPDVPLLPNSMSEESYNAQKLYNINLYKNRLKQKNLTPQEKQLYENLIESFQSKAYSSTESGPSCVYTATGNYCQDGINRRVSGTRTFYSDPLKYGFEEVDRANIQSGDLALDFDEDTPAHMMMFDSYGDDGKAKYNYSNGGDSKEAIRKQANYDDRDVKYYTFVGTPDDQRRWSEEYIRTFVTPNLKVAGIDVKTSSDKLQDKIDLKSKGGNVKKKLIKKCKIGNSLNHKN